MSGCPYLEANGWHMYVGYWKPDGTPGYACHGCGEMPKPGERCSNPDCPLRRAHDGPCAPKNWKPGDPSPEESKRRRVFEKMREIDDAIEAGSTGTGNQGEQEQER